MSHTIAVWNQKRHEQRNYIKKLAAKNKALSHRIRRINKYADISANELVMLKKLSLRARNILCDRWKGKYVVYLTRNKRAKLTTMLTEDGRIASKIKDSIGNGRGLVTLNHNQRVKLYSLLRGRK